jgi:DNA-3-methyladenine glycosylase
MPVPSTSAPGPLPVDFYSRPTLDVLEDIIGKVLVHTVGARRTSGVIVEAEAYIGEDDGACHAACGPTPRNAPLYGEPGRAYVYLNYGLHHLVNAVTEAQGRPAAILLRALAPLEGGDLMHRRRERLRWGASARDGRPRRVTVADEALCRGPGNLTVALGITLDENGKDLTAGSLVIEDHGIRPPALGWTPRVGIRRAADRPWRCVWTDHPSVSGGVSAAAAIGERRRARRS